MKGWCEKARMSLEISGRGEVGFFVGEEGFVIESQGNESLKRDHVSQVSLSIAVDAFLR